MGILILERNGQLNTETKVSLSHDHGLVIRFAFNYVCVDVSRHCVNVQRTTANCESDVQAEIREASARSQIVILKWNYVDGISQRESVIAVNGGAAG